MKKALRITTVALIGFAIVSNLYTSLFTFYGIKTNNLQGAVWANALATTGGSSSGSSSGSGTTTSGTNQGWFNTGMPNKIWCGEIKFVANFNGGQTAGASGTVTDPATGAISASVSGGYVMSATASGTIAAHWANENRCTGPLAITWCTDVTGINACM